MKADKLVFNAVEQRRVISHNFSFLRALTFVLILALLASTEGCKSKKSSLRIDDGQKASKEEKERQNRNLIDQAVQAMESQEKYPDAVSLRGALDRLTPWLAERPESPDFVFDSEYAALANAFEELSTTVKKTDELFKLFSDESQKPNEKNCDDLQATLQTLKKQLDPLAESLKSNALTAFGVFVDDVLDKLASAREFQFAEPTESFQTQIRQVVQDPSYQYYNFATLFTGLEDYKRLLKLDGKIFLPQDVDYLRSVVWFRDVFNWAKGAKQDDLTIVKELFDWTIKNVVLADPLKTPMGSVAQLEWQTLLLGQGTPMDRAIVFIELLRQHRLDAFVARPKGEIPDNFPVVAGVRLDGKAYLFDMTLGLPFVSSAPDSLALEEGKGLVVNRIATLAEVAEDDSILRKFDLPERPYLASADDFKDVVAYVPSTPFHVAARMIPLEQEFSGSVNTVLSTPFDVQKERIAELDGVSEVKRLQEANAPILEQTIFPEESELVARVFMTPLESSGSLEIEGTSEEGSSADEIADYTGDSSKKDANNVSGKKKAEIAPLWIGKILYLRGQFVDDTGAAHWLLQGRVSERVLKRQEANIRGNVAAYLEEYRNWAAKQNQPVSDDELRTLAAQTTLTYQLDIAAKRFIKTLTSYNLALLSEASGSDSAAMERLNDESLRLNRAKTDSMQLGDEFRNAANYLRARLLEKKGAWASAAARLQAGIDYGSFVRAKWIADLAGINLENPAQTSKTEAPTEGDAAEPQANEPQVETSIGEEHQTEQQAPEADQGSETQTEQPAGESSIDAKTEIESGAAQSTNDGSDAASPDA